MKKIIMMVLVLCMGFGLVGCNSSQDVIYQNKIHERNDGKKCLVIGVEEPDNANDIKIDDYISDTLSSNKQAKSMDEIFVVVYDTNGDKSILDKLKTNTLENICVCEGMILSKDREECMDLCIRITNNKDQKIYEWGMSDSVIGAYISPNEKGSIKY